jgi:hypothetical protein
MPQEAKIINEISNSTQDWWPPKRVVAETRDNICGKKMMEAGAAEHQCGERQHAGPWISEAETDDEMWGELQCSCRESCHASLFLLDNLEVTFGTLSN